MKTFLVLAVALTQCHSPTLQVNTACEVLHKTLYADGKFMLSSDEVDHLTEANAIKVSAVKIFYKKNCLNP